MCFPAGPLFLVFFFYEMFMEVPISTISTCPEKCLIMRLHSGIILFAKLHILNFWQCAEYFPVSVTAQ